MVLFNENNEKIWPNPAFPPQVSILGQAPYAVDSISETCGGIKRCWTKYKIINISGNPTVMGAASIRTAGVSLNIRNPNVNKVVAADRLNASQTLSRRGVASAVNTR